jgi:hypothetical protein
LLDRRISEFKTSVNTVKVNNGKRRYLLVKQQRKIAMNDH